jgi:glycosyltransferase involved in cell wall biosynthesis
VSADGATVTPREIWVHALGAKAGGGKTYLAAVLPELERQLAGRGVRVVLLVPEAPPVPVLSEWIDVRVMTWASANGLARAIFDQVVLPLWVARRPGAVLYCSGSFAPLVKTVPTVALLRNAIYFDDAFLGRERRRRRVWLTLQGRAIAACARACRAVHYPSRSMRALVEGQHPHLAKNGRVNTYGISEVFAAAPDDDREPAQPARKVSRFLYVMNYTLQKNLGLVLRALVKARAEGLPVEVVVTSWLDQGPASCARQDRALIEAHDLVTDGYLVPVGPRFGQALLDLYRSVDACIFPSVCESFGHPLVEALALGKPLVCADRPYAREICGPNALYVDPENPDDLVDVWRAWPAIASRIADVDRAELHERFSWRAHVARLLGDLLGDDPIESTRRCAG